VPPLSYLTFCTPTKSNLYLADSLTTVVIDPDLYRLLMFHVPNVISLFHSLGCTDGSGLCVRFVTWFYHEELLAHRPTPKLEDRLLSAVRDCLLSIFAATLHIWGSFLHPQSKDAPCRDDRDPLTVALKGLHKLFQVYLPEFLSSSSPLFFDQLYIFTTSVRNSKLTKRGVWAKPVTLLCDLVVTFDAVNTYVYAVASRHYTSFYYLFSVR
jgi:hypothetical protein